MPRLAPAVVVLLVGCDDPLGGYRVRHICVHEIQVVDSVTGAVDLILDDTGCDTELTFPDRITYALLRDAMGEPMRQLDPRRRCSLGEPVLEVTGLARDALAFDPADPHEGAQVQVVSDSPGLVDDAWHKVHYDVRDTYEERWQAWFRLGSPDVAYYAEACEGP